MTASAEGYAPAFVDVYIRQRENNSKVTLTLKKVQKMDMEFLRG
jgi:hypothetical protein